jgi:hypothetical protein
MSSASHSGNLIWFQILLSRSLAMHLDIQSVQTEGGCMQASDIHAGGRRAEVKSSVHIIQVVG